MQTNNLGGGKYRWNGKQCWMRDQQATELNKAAKVEMKFWFGS